MGVAGNPALAWFIWLGWILWNLGTLAYGIILVSKYLFAEAFDRFLPSKMAYVTKWGSLVAAHLLALVVVIILIGGTSFLYLLYQFLALPSVWGGNPFAYSYVGVSFLAGAILYAASKYYHRKQGIDISLAYTEIPPE